MTVNKPGIQTESNQSVLFCNLDYETITYNRYCLVANIFERLFSTNILIQALKKNLILNDLAENI